MGYAINGSSMRAVESAEDCIEGETFFDELPTPWPPALSASDAIKEKIAELEAQVTDRRIREAVLGVDGGWLKEQDAKISALRSQLK